MMHPFIYRGRYRFFFLVLFYLPCFAQNSPAVNTVNRAGRPKIYVHYMPWFEDKLSSGNSRWGQHWTMANKNPDSLLLDGRREIASFYYPVIDPYSSADPDALFQLAKLFNKI